MATSAKTPEEFAEMEQRLRSAHARFLAEMKKLRGARRSVLRAAIGRAEIKKIKELRDAIKGLS